MSETTASESAAASGPSEHDPKGTMLKPEEHVLATLRSDGTRRWIRPRLSKGQLLTARRIVAYGLMVIFIALPHITIGGKPAILLDILHREFTLLGTTFVPTDTPLLMLFLLSVFVTVFLLTALFGRVWCG
ncbi:MAG TPA: cytochrome c oxidase accessory protein CcoG, partial [Planctomycetes bacterium]|nr:cytochrome c oxidase accessory protein CcoG [Planctomycetota bacterium]